MRRKKARLEHEIKLKHQKVDTILKDNSQVKLSGLDYLCYSIFISSGLLFTLI